MYDITKEKDHNRGTNGHGQLYDDSLFRRSVWSGLAAALEFPATVLGHEEQPNEVTWQKTRTSTQDPLYESHQAAYVLPLESNRVWVGEVSWTGSKSVEVVMLLGLQRQRSI